MKISPKKTSLRGLRIFCVAAKYRNYTLAAEELSVTSSAVSHQVKSLEDELGLELFTRERRTLRLTEQGAHLFRELEPAIAHIDGIIAEAQSKTATSQLRVSVQPFFASECFVPLLEDFTERNPGIEIFVDTSDETAERHPVSADASIRLFRQKPRQLESDALFPLRLIAACSPEFLKRYRKGQEFTPFPILVHTSRPEAWNLWSKATGITLPPATSVVRLDSMIAVARAAERGVGAALVPVPLSDNWFKYGALVPMFDEIAELPETFYLAYPKAKAEIPEVQSLRQWVLDNFQE
ncbi:MAG: LysR family glycine cleavage system transcriptional activator [Glaciecola sp.]|jgi:LysR family glycine cleavage system transcriptional activator|uniref:LysR substrate-binding domain-containing protein n=1 Tax=Congregibacter sp. TaxID=2744308 RepID=UPI0039E52490